MDVVQKFRYKRIKRLENRFGKYHGSFRLDADDDTNQGSNVPKGGHGNTRIPYGLCQREGIEVQEDWTPSDAWAALEGKGYSAKSVYSELKKTGKVPSSPKDVHGGTLEVSYKDKKPVMSKEEAEKAYKDYHKEERKIKALEKEREKTWDAYRDARWDYNSIEYVINRSNEKIKALESKESLTVEEREELEKRKRDTESAKENLAKAKVKMDDAKAEDDKALEKINKAKEDHKNALKQYHEAVKVKFPSYDDCTTKKELIDRFNANEYFEDARESRFGVVGLEEGKAIAKKFDEFFDKVPYAKGKLGPVDVCGIPEGYYGQSSGSGVDLGAKWFRDLRYFKWSYDWAVKTKFHPEGTNHMSVITHEYSHQIDGYLGGLLGKVTGGWTTTISTAVFSEVIENLEKANSPLFNGIEEMVPPKKVGKDRDDWIREKKKEIVKRSVSEYAYAWKGQVHENSKEFFAEAYCEYLDSENPREVAREVGKVMDKYLRIFRERGLLD